MVLGSGRHSCSEDKGLVVRHWVENSVLSKLLAPALSPPAAVCPMLSCAPGLLRVASFLGAQPGLCLPPNHIDQIAYILIIYLFCYSVMRSQSTDPFLSHYES